MKTKTTLIIALAVLATTTSCRNSVYDDAETTIYTKEANFNKAIDTLIILPPVENPYTPQTTVPPGDTVKTGHQMRIVKPISNAK